MLFTKIILTDNKSPFFEKNEETWIQHMRNSYFTRNDDFDENYILKMEALKNIYARFLSNHNLQGKKVIVMGAGRGYDIPMAELCRRFDEVYSYDIDINSLKHSLDELTPLEKSKVTLVQANLSLFSEETIEKVMKIKEDLARKISQYSYITFKSSREKFDPDFYNISPPDYKKTIIEMFRLMDSDLGSYRDLPEFNNADLIVTSKVIYLANIIKVEELFFSDLKKLIPEYKQRSVKRFFPEEYKRFAASMMNYAIRDLSNSINDNGSLLLQEVEQNLLDTGVFDTIDEIFDPLDSRGYRDLEISLLKKSKP